MDVDAVRAQLAEIPLDGQFLAAVEVREIGDAARDGRVGAESRDLDLTLQFLELFQHDAPRGLEEKFMRACYHKVGKKSRAGGRSRARPYFRPGCRQKVSRDDTLATGGRM
ncbi:MAG: hypothetical protein IPP94_16600 [Ignavibacteria bacterium]|nr:hypothetical protein [Ignavibacteria bacterium]